MLIVLGTKEDSYTIYMAESAGVFPPYYKYPVTCDFVLR